MSWETAKRRRAEGLCVGCGKPLANGRTKCPECAEQLREYQRERYSKLVKQHRCGYCGRPLPNDWYYCLCERCREDKNARQREYKRRKKERERGKIDGTVSACLG